MRTRPGHREMMKGQFMGARVDEHVWSLEQMEWAFRADGVDLLEARVRAFALYVDQLFNLNNCYNRQRRLDHNEEQVGLIFYPSDESPAEYERRTP